MSGAVRGSDAVLTTEPDSLAAYARLARSVEAHDDRGRLRTVHHELGRHGVTSNMVLPGMTITDLTADVPMRLKQVEVRKKPMCRLGTTTDAAGAIAFLGGDQAGYVNGVNIPVTRGPVGA